MAILLLKGTCGAEMTAEQKAAYDKEWERGKQLAVLYYPDADKKETPLRKKMIEMSGRMDDADDPLFYSPNRLFVLTVMAASELGIKPAKPFFSEQPAAPQPQPTAKEGTPQYVTPDQIKTYWYNQIPTPSTMDRDFYRAKKAREKFVADVKAGKYDLSAEKTATEFNRQEALKFGDNERATLCETELARIAQQEAENQRRIDADKARRQAEMANSQMSSLRCQLDSLNADMSRIRRSIQQP